MPEDRQIYFQFKVNVRQNPGEPLYLKDIVEISGPGDLMKEIEEIIVAPDESKETMVITAIQVIQLIRSRFQGVTIQLVGEGKALVEPRKTDSSLWSGHVATSIKVAVTTLLLFIGSALAIMYFHADVNMHQVHQMIYKLLTGKDVTRPYLINIPYSIGIGIGIAVFFGIFSVGKKKNNPGPLELEIYNYENDVYSYIRDQEEEEEQR